MQGRGKQGSHRKIIIMRAGDKAIFAHGFAKGERDNIAKNELEGFKVMAEAFLGLNDEQLTALIDKQNLIEVFLNE